MKNRNTNKENKDYIDSNKPPGAGKHRALIAVCFLVLVVLILLVWFHIPYSPLKADFNKDIAALQRDSVLYDGDTVFSEEDFEGCPTALRKYIENCGYIGKRKMNFMKMEYRDVAFSQGRNGPDLTIDYTQYDFLREPERLALIDSSMFGIPFQGYDYYIDGHGGMKGVIAKSVTLFDQTGEEMDRACLATFLAESMFAPSAFLQDYIALEEVDEYEVKATISAYGQTVSGVFGFNEDYEMVSFSTKDRAVYGTDGTVEYIPWSAVCGDYEIGTDGIKHPTVFQAVWNYPDGDFVYFDGSISSIEYQ